MYLSVEISLYPLQNGHIPIIDSFLMDINENQNSIEIRTSNMSTRLYGEYSQVTQLLNQAMLRSMQKYGKVVFVCKFIEGDARELESLNTVNVK